MLLTDGKKVIGFLCFSIEGRQPTKDLLEVARAENPSLEYTAYIHCPKGKMACKW